MDINIGLRWYSIKMFLFGSLQAWSAKLSDPPQITEEDIDTSKWPQNNLIVAISSDRGLCGGKSKNKSGINLTTHDHCRNDGAT